MVSEAVTERAAPAPPGEVVTRGPDIRVAAGGAGEAAGFTRPYRRSWLNVLFDAIDAAPVPAWSIYLVATIVSVIGSNSVLWISGLAPVGSLDPQQSAWGVITIAGFWFVHYLDRVAGASFDAFQPLLDDDPGTLARLRYELVVVPAVPALGITMVAMLSNPLYYALDPVAAQVVGYSPAGLVLRAISEGLFGAVLLILAYHTYRQLRRVSALHARAREVDLFRPGPLYAFSRLTAQTGAAFILAVALGYVLNPAATSDPSTMLLWLPWFIAPPLFGVFVFIAPLWGMHRRLEVEKTRLRDDSEQRLKRLMGQIDRDVDAGDLSRADGLNKSLSSLLQQREVIAKLSTWPWSATTARGFGTAIMLPLILFVIQRLLGQFV